MDKKEYSKKIAELVAKEKKTTNSLELKIIREELLKLKKEYHDSRVSESMATMLENMKKRN